MSKIVKRFDKENKKADLYIYDEIGFWGINAKDAIKEINNLGDVSEIELHLNSPGGVISDGIAIYNAIKRTNANVTTYVDGLAASIASVIALAGDMVVMAEGSLFMIHDPWSMMIGSAEDMRKEAEVLDTHKDTILGIYENATGKGSEELSRLMSEETWLQGQEAVDMGFADGVEGEVKAAACVRDEFVKERFRNAPDLKAFAKNNKNLDTEEPESDNNAPETGEQNSSDGAARLSDEDRRAYQEILISKII